MNRKPLLDLDEKSEDSSHQRGQLLKRSHQFNLRATGSGFLSVKNVDVTELIKSVAAKARKIKLSPNESYYLQVQTRTGEVSLIMVPKAATSSLTESPRNETKLMQQFMNSYSIYQLDESEALGEGGQGRVVKGHELITNEIVAIKICKMHNNEVIRKQIENERKHLATLDRLYGYCSLYSAEDEGSHGYPEATIMKYYPGVRLDYFLYRINTQKDKNDPDYYQEKIAMNIFKKVGIVLQMISQLDLIHRNKIIHRDIKPSNFIFNETEEGKVEVTLIDLGEAILVGEISRVYRSTFGYCATEICVGNKKRTHYTVQSDYFSLGVAIAEVLSSKNYQFELAALKQKQSAMNELSELTRREIYALLRDVIVAGTVSKSSAIPIPQHFNYYELADYLDEVIYNKWMKHSMHALILSLTKKDPKDRLAGTELVSELRKLQDIYRHCLGTSKAMRKIAQEIIYVCNVLDITKTKISKSDIYEQFIKQLNEVLREQDAHVDLQDLPQGLIATAADQCITFFSRHGSPSNMQPKMGAELTK